MPNDEQRTRARLAVSAVLASRGWSPARLAKESGADPGTIGDFLAGRRWIKLPTQGKIERALGWEHGTISSIEAGAEPPALIDPDAEPDAAVGADAHPGLGQWLTRAESEMTDEEMEELWGSTEHVLEALKAQILSRRRRGSTLGDS